MVDPVEEPFTGKDVLRTRIRLKLNQTEFGLRLGYRHPQIRVAEIETGRRKVPKRIQQICEESLKMFQTGKF